MPELPEVHTTVAGLQKVLPHLTITKVWTDYGGPFHKGKSNIKDTSYFKRFKGHVVGKKVVSVSRRAKNILINLGSGYTILIHMKMTGHLLYGKYEYKRSIKGWRATEAGPLRDDPFNRWVHFVISFSNGRELALSDLRKFAKVTLIETPALHDSTDLKNVGSEPLDKTFTFEVFRGRLKRRPSGKIKQVLMDQSVIAGIGNIYSDEMLWLAGIHPDSMPAKIPPTQLKLLFVSLRKVLKKGIDFGGDSMSDYRNIHGLRGTFQHKHNVYQRTGEHCKKGGCSGTIERRVIGGRSGHFCPKHQKLFK